jgi:hypothetical protein
VSAGSQQSAFSDQQSARTAISGQLSAIVKRTYYSNIYQIDS